MTSLKKVLAICGSTRVQSSNLHLINAIAGLNKDRLEFSVYNNLALLPHFNPDLDTIDMVPEPVRRFREQIKSHDGILICTPEYAHGVPGSLKNAIDWIVSQSGFSGKPVVLITASTDGRSAHSSLLETLRVIEAPAIDKLQLLISFIKTKVNAQQITDPETRIAIDKLMDAFMSRMDTII